MRVIAGSAKKARLVAPSGRTVRPTTDRVKETLFNMIQAELFDCVFLDMFSGSGAIGIEALSRGAKKAVFIERDKEAVSCIRKNLEHTKLADQATVLAMDVFEGIEKLKKRNMRFDLIFIDPPYEGGMEGKVLKVLERTPLVDRETQIIMETSVNTTIDYLQDFHYHIDRVKTYKTSQHVFLSQLEKTRLR